MKEYLLKTCCSVVCAPFTNNEGLAWLAMVLISKLFTGLVWSPSLASFAS